MFRRLLASELHRPDPFVLAGPAVHELSVSLRRDAPGYRVAIELRDAKGQVVVRREHLERTCADAVDRALIVVMLEVFSPAPAAEGRAEKGAADDERIRAKNRQIDELEGRLSVLEKAFLEKKRTAPMDFSFSLAAGALLSVNLTSNAGPGAWIGGDVRTGPVSAGLELRAVLPSRADAGPFTLDYSQYMALVTPCGRYWYVFGCAAIGGGLQIESDTDPGFSTPRNTFYHEAFQVGGRLGAEVPFGDSRFGARAWGEVLYTNPPLRLSYYSNKYRWDRPDVSAFFGAGLFVLFGK